MDSFCGFLVYSRSAKPVFCGFTHHALPFSPCAIAGFHPDKKRGYPRKGNLLNLYFGQSYTRRLLLLRRRLNILECLANLVAYAALDVALHRAYQAADSLCR